MKYQTFKRAAALVAGNALAFGTLMAAVSPVSAAGPASTGAVITPTVIELVGNPGDKLVKSLSLKNASNVSETYTTFVNSLYAGTESGNSAFGPVTPNDLSGWIKISPETLTLSPDQGGTITVNIEIPRSAAPGGHYATVFAVAGGGAVGRGSGASLQQAIGSHILLNIQGNVSEGANVVEFSTARGRVSPGEPVDFTVRIKNTGNTHVKPTGVVEIYRGNTKVDEVAVNADGGSILPGSVRKFSVSSTKTLPSGAYRAVLAVKYGGNNISVPSISFVVLGESSMAAIIATVLGIFVVILLAALLVNRRKPGMGARRV